MEFLSNWPWTWFNFQFNSMTQIKELTRWWWCCCCFKKAPHVCWSIRQLCVCANKGARWRHGLMGLQSWVEGNRRREEEIGCYKGCFLFTYSLSQTPGCVMARMPTWISVHASHPQRAQGGQVEVTSVHTHGWELTGFQVCSLLCCHLPAGGSRASSHPTWTWVKCAEDKDSWSWLLKQLRPNSIEGPPSIT